MELETVQQPATKPKRLNQGQGLAEYSLIIALVGVACVFILAVLGRGTRNTIHKVTCAAGSTDPQCSCINEKLSVVGACIGSTLSVTVTSSCAGSTLTVYSNSGTTPYTVNSPSAPVCTGGATSFTVQSFQPAPYSTSNSYSVSKP